jgi:hypothetical protein
VWRAALLPSPDQDVPNALATCLKQIEALVTAISSTADTKAAEPGATIESLAAYLHSEAIYSNSSLASAITAVVFQVPLMGAVAAGISEEAALIDSFKERTKGQPQHAVAARMGFEAFARTLSLVRLSDAAVL